MSMHGVKNHLAGSHVCVRPSLSPQLRLPSSRTEQGCCFTACKGCTNICRSES